MELDAKSKILIIVVYLFFLLLIISFEQLLIAFIYWAFLLIVFNARLKQLLVKATAVLPLVFSLGLLTWWGKTTGSTLALGDAMVSYSRLGVTLFYVLRSLLLVFTALLLIESEDSFFSIIYALDELHVPHLLVSILLFMYRTFLDLRVEGKKMLEARYSRGSYKSSWARISEYQIIGYMLGSIFVRALNKSQQRRDALVSRMYSGTFYHDEIRFSTRGIFILWITLIFCLIVLILSKIRLLNYGVLGL